MEDLACAAGDLAVLATRLLLHLGQTNLALSPLSFHSVLVLLAAGATGDTLNQIVSFLGPAGGTAHAALASQAASGVFANGAEPDVRCAVGVWVDSSLRLRPAFADKVASQFNAGARAMPIRKKSEESRVEINSWFENKTGGLIRDLMPDGHLDSTTALVIGNALYLKGAWRNPFHPEHTVDGDFYLTGAGNGGRARVPFMTSTEQQLISSHPGFKVLQLPYKGGGRNRRLSMHIYLPDERDGLPALLRELGAADTAAFLERSAPARAVEVGEFRVPKFRVSLKVDAKKLLRELGLERPFSFTRDFAEMVDCPEPLAVSAVLHECVVEVNEHGTMAAAATEADIVEGSCGLRMEEPARVDFVADHPFLFFVRDDYTGVVLFAGQVVNPLL